MGLSNPRSIFGIHEISPYRRDTGKFYGKLRVLSGSSISFTGEQIKLNGGSNKYPWSVESGLITSEMTLKFKEYPGFVFELFFGKAATEVLTPSATGEINDYANVKGVSIKDAVNGLSSITIIPSTGSGNLKFGRYVLVATDSDTVDIYVSSDLNFDRGTSEDYTDDLLKVDTVDISAATNDVVSLGLRFNKTGTPAFVVGDTATFDVLPPYSSKMSVVVGAPTDTTPEFGALIAAEKRADLSIVYMDVFRAKATGMPIGLEAKTFSESEVKVDCLYDSAKSGVFKFLSVNPSS